MFDITLTAHLAELSKLAFTEDELQKMATEMDAIVKVMDTVGDFSSDESFTGVAPAGMDELREDTACASMDRQDILANASENGDTYFKVPKVV